MRSASCSNWEQETLGRSFRFRSRLAGALLIISPRMLSHIFHDFATARGIQSVALHMWSRSHSSPQSRWLLVLEASMGQCLRKTGMAKTQYSILVRPNLTISRYTSHHLESTRTLNIDLSHRNTSSQLLERLVNSRNTRHNQLAERAGPPRVPAHHPIVLRLRLCCTRRRDPGPARLQLARPTEAGEAALNVMLRVKHNLRLWSTSIRDVDGHGPTRSLPTYSLRACGPPDWMSPSARPARPFPFCASVVVWRRRSRERCQRRSQWLGF